MPCPLDRRQMSDTPAQRASASSSKRLRHRPLRATAYLLSRWKDWFFRLEEEVEGTYREHAALKAARGKVYRAGESGPPQSANVHNGPVTFASPVSSGTSATDEHEGRISRRRSNSTRPALTTTRTNAATTVIKAVRAVAQRHAAKAGYLDGHLALRQPTALPIT